jgi:hypothetical protein
MKQAALTALFALTLAPMLNAQAPRTGQVTLDGLRETSRPLLIFAPRPDDPQLEIQLRTLAEHAPGVTERDITILALPYNNPSPSAATLSSTEADNARRRYHVNPADFTIILVGKDGGEKLRSLKPISFDKLQNTIDAMPMRQEEMRNPQKTKP